jgi:hypothetical protein
MPYLPVVMATVIRGATQEIQFSMEDVLDEEDEDDVENADGEQRVQSAIISLGGGVRKRVTLNTHAVQQKNQAARLLYELASAIRGHLGVHLPGALQALLPLLIDKHSADIRSSASLAVAKLFSAYVHATQLGYTDIYGHYVSLDGVLQICLDKLHESLKGEIQTAVRICAAEAIRDVLQVCYASGIEHVNGTRSGLACSPDAARSARMIKEIMGRCKESLERRQNMEGAVHDNEGLDAEDMVGNEELEEEEELLSNLVDGIGHFLKLNGEAIMHIFDGEVAPAFAAFVNNSQPAALQIIGICILDDIIEFGGESAIKYIPQALQCFSTFAASSHTVVRQSATYGIAQAAHKAPEVFVQHLATFLPLLVNMLDRLNIDDEDNAGTIDNIVFALSIIYCNSNYRAANWGGVTPEMVAVRWIKRLPLSADEVEAKVSHALFCDCLERLDPAILGDGNANISEVLRICSDLLVSAMETEARDENDVDDYPLLLPSSIDKLIRVLRQLASGMPTDALTQHFQALSVQQQHAMNKAIL